MVLHNPNNWHWVNKDVKPWANDYLEQNAQKISAEENGVSAKVVKLTSLEGDVDVSQRKGKVITVYDVSLRFDYEGKNAEGSDVAGSIKVPECAYDTTYDEYVFEIDIFSETKEKQPVKDLVKAKLVPQLRELFQKLTPALIEEHGKDIQHAAGSNPNSGFATPTWHPSKERNPIASSSTSKAGDGAALVNTTTVTANNEFRTTAEELYNTFTDPQRVAAFTRAAPKQWDGIKTGDKFAIFDGNVTGEIVKSEKPKQLVQKWRLAQWPSGHYSLLELNFDQNDVDQVTNLRVSWTGVPIGQEDVVQRNWEQYYVRSIYQTFGFGTIL